MVTLLVWSLMLIDSFLPNAGEVHLQDPPDAARLAEIARGRLLIGRIKTGMTSEQVEKILGRMVGGHYMWGADVWHKDHRGFVVVSYREGKVISAGVYRIVVKRAGGGMGTAPASAVTP